jgi:DNA-binding NtrC family response regulator
MEGVFRWLAKAATMESPVVIEGEPGVGKLLAARALHRLSSFGGGPLVVLESSQLTIEELLEVVGRAAKSPTPGTVVLRRVEDLDARVQPIVVRVLKERRGDSQQKPRLVATAFRSLQQAVRDGRFREDLYFRLNVLPLVIPPLRDRQEDIPALIRYALGRDALGRPRSLSLVAMERALTYPWPGNVRELLQLMDEVKRRTSATEVGLEYVPELLARGPITATAVVPLHPPTMIFGPGLLPPPPPSLFESLEKPTEKEKSPAPAAATPDAIFPVSEHLPFKEAKNQLLVAFEREYLARLLKRCGGSITKTAQQSGLHRKSIERLVKKYQLKQRKRGRPSD